MIALLVLGAAATAVPAPIALAPSAPFGAFGVTVQMPNVAGWRLDGAVLRGPSSAIGVALQPEPCAKWAGTNVAAPDWAPTSLWPSGRASPGGVAACLQRDDDAAILTLGGVVETHAPDADTSAVLLAVVDALRPPLHVATPSRAEGLTIRLPYPVVFHADSGRATGFDGADHFDFYLWVNDGACFLHEPLVPDDDTRYPWIPAHGEPSADIQTLCAEASDHALGLKWPLSELPLRAPTLRALGALAIATWGAPITNADGTIAIAGKRVHLDPQTAGHWKLLDRTQQLTSLDADVPFVLEVATSATCPLGKALPEERSQGFAPPALLPVSIVPVRDDPATKLRLVSCLHLDMLDAVIEIHALSDAAEPPSGPAAVKIRAALVAVASALGVEAELSAHARAPHSPADGRDRGPSTTTYRSDIALWGGLISLAKPGEGPDRGAMIGGDLRASPKYGIGLAANIAGELGYTSGIEEEVRGGVGVGFGVGVVSVQATAGLSAGSVGNGGDLSAYAQGSALLDLRFAIVSAAVMRTFAEYGDDETRFDARIAIAPGGERGTIVAGGQLVEFGENGGSAFVAYIGFGVTNAHDAAPPP